MNSMEQGRSELLHRIQAEDFALYEVVLYLDAHPKNKRALSFYEEHRTIAAMLRAEYEQRFGPLSVNGNNDPAAWRWVEGPWPWEKEAN